MVYRGVVKDNTVVMDPSVRLPGGQVVEVRVSHEGTAMEEAFAKVMARRAANAGHRVDIDAITEEGKHGRDARDLEILNREADRLNEEAADVLQHQASG